MRISHSTLSHVGNIVCGSENAGMDVSSGRCHEDEPGGKRFLEDGLSEEVSMRGAMLFAAGLFTGLAVHVAMAQNANRGVVMMNHVGINVPNIEEAVKYYTEKMGYREAFRVFDEKKQPRLVYMQISKNTFLELNPANAQRPAGFTHYGLHVENAADAVALFKQRGVMVSDTNVSDTKAVLANITDPYMGRIELAELTPDSLHYKAIQSWK
jgi:catechol 2,3-dioxygenase-like lactoylglutathione lyase family enzyme